MIEILQLTYSSPYLSSTLEMLSWFLSNSPLHQFKITWCPVTSEQMCTDLLDFATISDLTSVGKTLPNQSVIPHRSCESLSHCKSGSGFRRKCPWLRIHFCCFIDNLTVLKNSLLFIPGDQTNQLMFKQFLHNDWVFWLGTM